MENVEYGSFPPLVFQTDDGMGCYCRKTSKRLADAFSSSVNMNATQ